MAVTPRGRGVPSCSAFREGLASCASMALSTCSSPAEHTSLGESFLKKHYWLSICLCWHWMYLPAWLVLKTSLIQQRTLQSTYLKFTKAFQYLSENRNQSLRTFLEKNAKLDNQRKELKWMQMFWLVGIILLTYSQGCLNIGMWCPKKCF